MVTHGKLANDNHLVEVIFELRYDSNKVTDKIVEEFHERLKPAYLHLKTLPVQVTKFDIQSGQDWQASSESDPIDIVRYSLASSKRDRICQLGNGIMSVHFLRYEGFDIFLREVSRVIGIHHELFTPTAFRRLGLRYINHFAFTPDRKQFDLLAWAAPTPPQGTVASNIQQVLLDLENEGFQSIVVAYPQLNQNNQSILTLDIENFLQFQHPVVPNIDRLRVWMNEAHESIWNTFVEALKQPFFEELQHGNRAK